VTSTGVPGATAAVLALCARTVAAPAAGERTSSVTIAAAAVHHPRKEIRNKCAAARPGL
jgi:hypothetical protein